MTAISISSVQVLSTDDRVIQASQALPADRYKVSVSSDMGSFLKAVATDCDVAIIELALNGYAACMETKSADGGASRRVVMICERGHDRWLCLQAGADAVVVKPFSDTSSLVEAVLSTQV